MSDHEMPKLNIKVQPYITPNLDLTTTTTMLNRINDQLESSRRMKLEIEQEEKRLEVEHRHNVERLLSDIVDNTSSISLMVELLQSSKGIQQEVLAIMQEMLTIGTAESVEEAESRYKKIMRQITDKVEDIETAEKLLTIGKALYHTGIGYLKINNGG